MLERAAKHQLLEKRVFRSYVLLIINKMEDLHRGGKSRLKSVKAMSALVSKVIIITKFCLFLFLMPFTWCQLIIKVADFTSLHTCFNGSKTQVGIHKIKFANDQIIKNCETFIAEFFVYRNNNPINIQNVLLFLNEFAYLPLVVIADTLHLTCNWSITISIIVIRWVVM